MVQKGSYQLGVVLKKNNYLIGDYFLEVIEPASVTVGYTFDSDFWHFGYATESFKVLLDILKNEYKFKRVFAHVYSDNFRSIRLLERMGFIQYEKSIVMGDIGFKLDL